MRDAPAGAGGGAAADAGGGAAVDAVDAARPSLSARDRADADMAAEWVTKLETKARACVRARLVVLFHASRCDGTAAVSGCKGEGTDGCKGDGTGGRKCKHGGCDIGRALWQHIPTCTATDCSVRHCASSRMCLAHVRACHTEDCDLCCDVRKEIARARMADAKQSKSTKAVAEST